MSNKAAGVSKTLAPVDCTQRKLKSPYSTPIYCNCFAIVFQNLSPVLACHSLLFMLLPQQVASAMAEAIASGGAAEKGLAKATATATCTGGATAIAFAEAWEETLTLNNRGCLVLTEAHAIAIAQCKDGVAFASASSEVLTRILGGCGIGNNKRQRSDDDDDKHPRQEHERRPRQDHDRRRGGDDDD
jgi:hypothetical protein